MVQRLIFYIRTKAIKTGKVSEMSKARYTKRMPRCLVDTLSVGSDVGSPSRVQYLRGMVPTHVDVIDELCRFGDFEHLRRIVDKYPSLSWYTSRDIFNIGCTYGSHDIVSAPKFASNRCSQPEGIILAFCYMHWDILDVMLPSSDPPIHVREAACRSVSALSYYMNRYRRLPFNNARMCTTISEICYRYGFDKDLLDTALALSKSCSKTKTDTITMLWTGVLPRGTQDFTALEVLDYIITHSPPGYWSQMSIHQILANVYIKSTRAVLTTRLQLEGCQQ